MVSCLGYAGRSFVGVDCCAAVHRMHINVLSGRVSAPRAARLACAVDSHPSGFSFLHYVLVYPTHTATCRCLEKVLSWGTCPHVIMVDVDQAMMTTPIAADFQYKAADIQLLLLYGTLPWPAFFTSRRGTWFSVMQTHV
jgi:hypothetical protein